MGYNFLSHNVLIAFGICVAAAMATVLGAFSVFTAKDTNPRLLACGLAFAGGAMIYISFVEIFNKSLGSFSEIFADPLAYKLSTLAFFIGVVMLVLLERLIPNPHSELSAPDRPDKKYLGKLGILTALAITAHNFPEGMATFFSTLEDPVVGSTLAFALAIHNIPEGISIAIPVYYATGSKRLTFLACFLSGMAEPLGAIIGYLILAPFLTPVIYGVVFGIIAGAMVFLAIDELLPTAKRYATGHDAVYGMVIGMAILAVSLVLLG